MPSKNTRYVHDEVVHNVEAAKEIVPYLLNLLPIQSVVDVGCGIGTWLSVFKDCGVHDLLGIDGNYVDKTMLKIPMEFFVDYDLETPFSMHKKFDIALSLEVAEHLKEESATIFVETLTRLSDVIVFSAAIKNQGGQNHINEQNPSYWVSKFESQGYTCLDILRPVFWNNEKVEFWYRQNMLLFTNNDQIISDFKNHNSFLNQHLVHPELLEIKAKSQKKYSKENARILAGKKGLKFYFKLVLVALKHKFDNLQNGK